MELSLRFVLSVYLRSHMSIDQQVQLESKALTLEFKRSLPTRIGLAWYRVFVVGLYILLMTPIPTIASNVFPHGGFGLVALLITVCLLATALELKFGNSRVFQIASFIAGIHLLLYFFGLHFSLTRLLFGLVGGEMAIFLGGWFIVGILNEFYLVFIKLIAGAMAIIALPIAVVLTLYRQQLSRQGISQREVLRRIALYIYQFTTKSKLPLFRKVTQSDSDVLEPFNQLPKSNRSKTLSEAIGYLGSLLLALAAIPVLFSIPVGTAFGLNFGLQPVSVGCVICIAVFFATTAYLWASFFSHYAPGKLMLLLIEQQAKERADK